MGLGSLHTIDLVTTRLKARECRLLLLDGKDPLVISRNANARQNSSPSTSVPQPTSMPIAAVGRTSSMSASGRTRSRRTRPQHRRYSTISGPRACTPKSTIRLTKIGFGIKMQVDEFTKQHERIFDV